MLICAPVKVAPPFEVKELSNDLVFVYLGSVCVRLRPIPASAPNVREKRESIYRHPVWTITAKAGMTIGRRFYKTEHFKFNQIALGDKLCRFV